MSPEATVAQDAVDSDRLRELERKIALLVGWTPAQSGERGEALTQLWIEWAQEYRGQGGSLFPPDHPELSDEAIAEIASRRRATRDRLLARAR